MYINRELSWLEFNQRVLDQACRTDLPLLERIKFLSITASNLDEFFQVRVGGLMLLEQSGKLTTDPAGLSPHEQLEKIRTRVAKMVRQQYALMNEELLPLLRREGLSPLSMGDLTPAQYTTLEQFFHDQVAPLLTPLAMEVEVPPTLPSLSLIVALELAPADAAAPQAGASRSAEAGAAEVPGAASSAAESAGAAGGVSGEGRVAAEGASSRFVAVPLPELLPRRVHSSALGKDGYVMLEDLVMAFIGRLFPGERVLHSSPFRVTRNGDIAVVEAEGGNFAREMEEVLVARKFSDCVRLEMPESTPPDFARRIAAVAGADASAMQERVPGMLRLVDWGSMAFEPGNDHLKIETWLPVYPASVDPSLSMFENMAQGDILINNPYENYEPVVRLVEEAAEDPDVLVIKQVLYRTAHQSRFIAALCRAAESGKQVTVLVELKARFDEGHNLVQAERLQRSGVRVVYGVRGFKTHAKVLLIVRRENGSLRRYCHFGTGNYNEKTARIYTDLSLLTCREELGADASQFFNSVTGLTRLMQFRRLYVSPAMMKARLLELIEAETSRAERGERAGIRAKMNSLNDAEMIRALDRAACAGVEIRLNVRGICCWAPSSPQAQKHTRIVSIVDRYLEHARIFHFHNGGNALVYIASADWMSRNLDRRVELMIPVLDAAIARRVCGILDACFRDNTQASLILPDGSSRPVPRNGKPFRMQEYLHRQALQRARTRQQERQRTLVPHLPRESEKRD